MNNEEMVIKFTLIPYNDKEDYERNFNLSLQEFAKYLKGRTLLAPLIVYNSELDIPIDNELEDYTVYCCQSQIEDVIRRQELNDVFRTLILHGFNITMDDVRDKYLAIARRNNANICVNVISDIDCDSNITLYLEDDIDKKSDEEWETLKEGMEKEIKDCIADYNDGFYDMMDDDFMDAEDLFETLMDVLNNAERPNKKSEEIMNDIMRDMPKPKPINKPEGKIIPLPSNTSKLDELTDSDFEDDVVSFSYGRNDAHILLSAINNDLFIIEDDEYEMLLSKDQIEFLIDAYYRIQDTYDKE